ncbi:hypothetical protein J7L29_07610 [Candidatus Bathyarchaeota archaeon]|nr:hypothetical protein [Candidatus Bathyarchaeota archaeon]
MAENIPWCGDCPLLDIRMLLQRDERDGLLHPSSLMQRIIYNVKLA